MSAYTKLKSALSASPRKWLVTGVAGFIGSNLLDLGCEEGLEKPADRDRILP